MAGAGRKTLCTPEVAQTICNNIAIGLSNKAAATLAGIDEKTFYNWYNRGKKEAERIAVNPARRTGLAEERQFFQFFQSVEVAKAKRIQVLVGRIQRAGIGGDTIVESRKTYKFDTDPLTGTTKRYLVEEVVTEKTRQPDWKADGWLLERLHPDEFGRRVEIDWRKQAAKDGVDDPDELFQRVVEWLASEMDGDADVGGDAGGPQEGQAEEEGEGP